MQTSVGPYGTRFDIAAIKRIYDKIDGHVRDGVCHDIMHAVIVDSGTRLHKEIWRQQFPRYPNPLD